MFTFDISGCYIANPHLFDGLIENIPDKSLFPEHIEFLENPPEISPDVLIGTIMHNCMGFEICYTDPEYLQWSITTWSRRERWIWEQLYETLCYKYVPYWNKDGRTSETTTGTSSGKDTVQRGTAENITRNENITENGSSSGTKKTTENIEYGGGTTDEHSGTDTRTTLGTEQNSGNDVTTTGGTTVTNTNFTPGSTTTEKVAGFNAESLVNNSQTVLSGLDTTAETETDQGHTTTLAHGHVVGTQKSDALLHGETIEHTDERTQDTTGDERTTGTTKGTKDDKETISKTGSDDSTTDRSGKTAGTREVYDRGNIGVTMSQTMIEAQRKLVTFDLYQFIADRFKNEFCVLIY